MRIGIVGAGMAGLACAEQLSRQGHDVRLFDKGRGPGGRMSSRRIPTAAGEAQFDHGAQYLTAHDEGFRCQVEAWVSQGVAARWPAAGNDAYVGVPAMNAPVRLMAEGHAVQWAALVSRIEAVGLGWRLILDRGDAVDVDIVVVATPAEQASALLAGVAPDLAARALAVPSEPCWTVMLAFLEPLGISLNCWRSDDVIGWAARNDSKPGRTGPESWVVQATPAWSKLHIEAAPEMVAASLKGALSDLLGIQLPSVGAESCHRWRFARSGRDGAGALFDPDRRLGVCGDWLIGPRVEAAWLSGRKLANEISAATA